MVDRPLKVAVISGEESGDLLGSDLVRAMAEQSGRAIELCGVGGRHLQSLGLRTLFDPSDIALMGLSGVVRDLPRLAWRIRSTAKAIVEQRPDVVITVDSPAFTLRVASRIRDQAPGIPIVKYVCPSVWAWGPWRAKRMKSHVDLVLCLLPFEAEVLQRLDGPRGIYVGHRLASDPLIARAFERQRGRTRDEVANILVLPGSRRSEVTALLTDFGGTLALLARRGFAHSVTIPTVPAVEKLVRDGAASWPIRPRIVTDAAEKSEAFARADAALAASGTVLLELALAGVPMISCYRSDRLMRMASRLITTWSAALPNLIADQVVIPEYYDEFVRPGLLARQIESLARDTPARHWQLDGFHTIRERMSTNRPSSQVAALAVISLIQVKTRS